MEKSKGRATLQMIDKAAAEGIGLAWDRYQKQLPQRWICGLGGLGTCLGTLVQKQLISYSAHPQAIPPG